MANETVIEIEGNRYTVNTDGTWTSHKSKTTKKPPQRFLDIYDSPNAKIGTMQNGRFVVGDPNVVRGVRPEDVTRSETLTHKPESAFLTPYTSGRKIPTPSGRQISQDITNAIPVIGAGINAYRDREGNQDTTTTYRETPLGAGIAAGIDVGTLALGSAFAQPTKAAIKKQIPLLVQSFKESGLAPQQILGRLERIFAQSGNKEQLQKAKQLAFENVYKPEHFDKSATRLGGTGVMKDEVTMTPVTTKKREGARDAVVLESEGTRRAEGTSNRVTKGHNQSHTEGNVAQHREGDVTQHREGDVTQHTEGSASRDGSITNDMEITKQQAGNIGKKPTASKSLETRKGRGSNNVNSGNISDVTNKNISDVTNRNISDVTNRKLSDVTKASEQGSNVGSTQVVNTKNKRQVGGRGASETLTTKEVPKTETKYVNYDDEFLTYVGSLPNAGVVLDGLELLAKGRDGLRKNTLAALQKTTTPNELWEFSKKNNISKTDPEFLAQEARINFGLPEETRNYVTSAREQARKEIAPFEKTIKHQQDLIANESNRIPVLGTPKSSFLPFGETKNMSPVQNLEQFYGRSIPRNVGSKLISGSTVLGGDPFHREADIPMVDTPTDNVTSFKRIPTR